MVIQLARGLAVHWNPKAPALRPALLREARSLRRGLRQSWRAYGRLRGWVGDVVLVVGLLRLLALRG